MMQVYIYLNSGRFSSHLQSPETVWKNPGIHVLHFLSEMVVLVEKPAEQVQSPEAVHVPCMQPQAAIVSWVLPP
jgi:hypothetical protein